MDKEDPIKVLRDFIPGKSPEEVRSQYIRLIKKYHPDRNPDDRKRCNRITMGLNLCYTEFLKEGIKADAPHPSARERQYEFRNLHGLREKVRSKEDFLYKSGIGLVKEAQDLLSFTPRGLEKEELELLSRVSALSYQGVQQLNKLLELYPDSIWALSATEWIQLTVKMTGRISHHLGGVDTREISLK